LDSVTVAPCKQNKEGEISQYLFYVQETDSTMIARVEVVENCCYDFLGDLGIHNDSTLNLIVYPYGEVHCACNCNYSLYFYLKKDCFGKSDGYSVPKAVVLNGGSAIRRLKASRKD